MRRHTQSGFSLVEILLVLGLIAILAIAAFVIYPQVRDESNGQEVAMGIRDIEIGISRLYGSSNKYNSLTTSTVVKAKIAPRNWLQPGSNNIWVPVGTGNMSVSSNFLSNGYNQGYSIGLTQVSQRECFSLLKHLNNAFVDRYTYVLVNNRGVYCAGKPSSIPKLLEACDLAPTVSIGVHVITGNYGGAGGNWSFCENTRI